MKQFQPMTAYEDTSRQCRTEESYRDIKNRPPEVIKTWQELSDGIAVQGTDDEENNFWNAAGCRWLLILLESESIIRL